MNLVIKSAIAVALLSAASVASFGATIQETIPGNGPVPNPGLTDGSLMLEVLNSATSTYDTVNLGSGLGAFKTLAGAAGGTVYDFGTISNFSTLFSSSDVSSGNVVFLVASGNSTNSTHNEGLVTLSSAQSTVSNGTVVSFNSSMGTAIGPFNASTGCNGTNPCASTGPTDQFYNSALATLNVTGANQSIIGLGQTTGTVGSSTGLEFYDILSAKAGSLGNGSITDLNGSWSISAPGDVTYTIAGGTVVTPLPAAIWLLGSGLLGIAGVGRRKKAA